MSSPYNYLAISEHLFSSAPTPPDLIYWLDMILLPLAAEVSPETIEAMQQHFDRVLAMIYFTLTLQLAALEALAFGTTTTIESTASRPECTSLGPSLPTTYDTSALDMYYEDASDSGYSSSSSSTCSPTTIKGNLWDGALPEQSSRSRRRAAHYRSRWQAQSSSACNSCHSSSFFPSQTTAPTLPTPVLSASGKRMSWAAPRRTFASTKEVVARRASQAGLVLEGAGKAYGGAAVFA